MIRNSTTPSNRQFPVTGPTRSHLPEHSGPRANLALVLRPKAVGSFLAASNSHSPAKRLSRCPACVPAAADPSKLYDPDFFFVGWLFKRRCAWTELAAVLRNSCPATRIRCGPPRGRTRRLESPPVLLRNDLAFKGARRPVAGASGSASEIQQARANLRTLAVRRDVDHRLQDLVHEVRTLGNDIAARLHKQARNVAPAIHPGSSRTRRSGSRPRPRLPPR